MRVAVENKDHKFDIIEKKKAEPAMTAKTPNITQLKHRKPPDPKLQMIEKEEMCTTTTMSTSNTETTDAKDNKGE